ncbi:MAG: ABC transporter permease [Deltaproteobacteria bacterium]
MRLFLHELKIALRTLLRSPAFALSVVATLTVGIGAATAVFSVVRGVLLAPLHFREPGRVVRLYNDWNGHLSGSLSPLQLRDDFSGLKTIPSVGAWAPSGATLTTGTDAVRLSMGLGTASLLPTLGVPMAYGRWFAADEEQIGHEHEVVLGPALWRKRFGGDPGVVGTTVRIDQQPYMVVGILSRDLDLPDAVDAWAPLAVTAESYAPQRRNFHFLGAVGRLAPSVSLQDARKELSSVAARVNQAFPDIYPEAGHHGLSLQPLRDDMVSGVRATLWMLLAAVALVLAMACANAGNLMFARSAARQRELAVRAALGAGKADLARQVLIESTLLAVVGGTCGTLLAAWGVDLLIALGPADLPRAHDVHVDPMVLGFALLATLLSGALFGLAPAISAGRVDLQSALRGATAQHARRLRRALVVAGVGLALVLLAGASLLARSFAKVLDVDPGFDPRGAVTLRAALPGPSGEDTPADLARYRSFFERALQRLRGLPGVTAAGGANILPMSGFTDRLFDVESRPTPPGAQRPYAEYRIVTGGFFEAAAIRTLRGRPIADADTGTAPLVAVVNETFTRKLLPGVDVLGQRVRVDDGGGWMTIVGVVADVHEFDLETPVAPQMYVPFAQHPQSVLSFLVRSPQPGGEVMRQAQEAIQSLDPTVPVYRVRPFDAVVKGSLAQRTFALALVQAFAAIAVLIAAIGLYGVLAYSVARRTREIGVRMALGAQKGHVLGLIVRESAAVVGLGALIGGAGALAAGKAAAGLLFGVGPLDPVALGAAVLVLALVCALATLLPARRAARVDPAVALRAE